jgi:DNA primase
VRVWINFKELRKRLKFEDVLRHYGVEVKRKGDGEQHQGFCPLPNHAGNKSSPSFSANLERGIFHCFGCGAKGNALEFAALMTGVDPNDGDALRSVAVELQQKFFPQGASTRTKPVAEVVATESKTAPVKVNEPLNFDLKNLDAAHPYLSNRRFTRETMQHFGVGFCARGVLKDRIAIPLHDSEGRLLGYAGRVVDDSLITDENPRYRFPSRREHGGIIFELRKTLFLYNGFRIRSPCDDLCVVEGFPSVWWLTQHGFPWSVALMGAECSEEQAELVVRLVKPSGRVWLIPDGDKAGERLAPSFLAQVAPHRFVRWIKLGEGRQPTDLPAMTLKENFAL